MALQNLSQVVAFYVFYLFSLVCPLGILVGLAVDSLDTRQLRSDPSLSWVFMPEEGDSPPVWSVDDVRDLYVLAKQGKSLRYQLWKFETVTESNRQLKEMDPQRANDGTSYVVPPGGVAEGLAGQVVLLHTKDTAS